MTDQEINEAVARKLGAKKLKDCSCSDPYDDHWELTHEWNTRKYAKHLPPYSTFVSAAWEITKMHEVDLFKHSGSWSCVIDNSAAVNADTAPMAICLAFLKLP